LRRRPALGSLFLVLAFGFAGIVYAAVNGAGDNVGRWVIAFAAGAIAVWLGTMGVRALR
jgi:spore maturation protein SpmA